LLLIKEIVGFGSDSTGVNGLIEKAVSGRWIAGSSIEDAVKKTRELNKKRERAILNYLGEEFTDKKDVDEACNTYEKLIKEIKKRGLKADISLKITQLGLRISNEFALENYRKIVADAKRNGIFVWLDMETADTVDQTIKIYESSMKSRNTGICIQAYLKRSAADISKLAKKGATIRLVKGAYHESEAIAWNDRKYVTKNYESLMRRLFLHSKKFTIATHDSKSINAAMKLENEKGNKVSVTYAMLNGIRNNYADILAKEGKEVSIYVPFGRRWLNYAYRRLREKENLRLIAESLLKR
jgi:proline dehydrogenase